MLIRDNLTRTRRKKEPSRYKAVTEDITFYSIAFQAIEVERYLERAFCAIVSKSVLPSESSLKPMSVDPRFRRGEKQNHIDFSSNNCTPRISDYHQLTLFYGDNSWTR
jgi:hypothetical protein